MIGAFTFQQELLQYVGNQQRLLTTVAEAAHRYVIKFMSTHDMDYMNQEELAKFDKNIDRIINRVLIQTNPIFRGMIQVKFQRPND